MKDWIPQIVIGIIVAVAGSLIADSILRGSKHRHSWGGSHYSGPVRGGR